MVSAKALAKQLSVLEIPDGPCIIIYRSGDRIIDDAVQVSILEALSSLGDGQGWLVTLAPGEDLAVLGDEELDRMGLQRKESGLTEESD